MRLLTTRWRSRLTVSQTGSVSVWLAGSGPPNPSEAMGTAMEPETTGAETTEPGTAAENGSLAGGSAGSAEEETGMEARGGDAGRAAEAAGATAAWGGAARARVSISSMSDRADDGWRGCDMAGGRGSQWSQAGTGCAWWRAKEGRGERRRGHVDLRGTG